MPTTKHPFVSSSSRPLSLRMRPDLIVREQSYQGRRYWVVKDPIALNYFRFEEEEYTLLSLLDGRISLGELRSEFESRFAPQQISAGEVHQFLGMLHRNSLVVSDAAGQGSQLQQRKQEKRSQQRRAAISNILALRLKGIRSRSNPWLAKCEIRLDFQHADCSAEPRDGRRRIIVDCRTVRHISVATAGLSSILRAA